LLTASASPATPPRWSSLPCVVCFHYLTSVFRSSKTEPPTKKSSRATESPPTTRATAACPASCGIGRRPSASRQMNAMFTLLVLAVTRPLALSTSSIPAPSARAASTSTRCPPPPAPRPPLSSPRQIPRQSRLHHALHHRGRHSGRRLRRWLRLCQFQRVSPCCRLVCLGCIALRVEGLRNGCWN
jgi:hypothetical protein